MEEQHSWRDVPDAEKDLQECSSCGARRIPGVFEDDHRDGCEFALQPDPEPELDAGDREPEPDLPVHFRGPTAPPDPDPGVLWSNTTTGERMAWDGSAWQDAPAPEPASGAPARWRLRFLVPCDDPRPVLYPPPGPWWCTGERMGEDPASVVVFVVDAENEQTAETLALLHWPDALEVEVAPQDGWPFSDRFPCPPWFDGELWRPRAVGTAGRDRNGERKAGP